MMARALYAIGAFIAGALLLYIVQPSSEPVIYREVEVREIQSEPVIERTFVDRIVYRDREPEMVVTEPEGGKDVVEDFCHPDTVQVVAGLDTLWLPSDTVFLMRSVSTHPGWFFGRSDIAIFGPTSVGALQEMRFRSYPGWSVRTDPELIFREPRFGLLREAVEAGVYIFIGYLGGRIF